MVPLTMTSTDLWATGTPSATKAPATRSYSKLSDVYKGPVCRQGCTNCERRPASRIGNSVGQTSTV